MQARKGPPAPTCSGYAVPFEEWPEETQQYYRYDPEEAERLLDEAGYPRGADGTRFSTIYQHYEFFDLGYYQIAMDYFRKIGIEVEIQEISRAQNSDFGVNRTYLGLRTDVWAAEYASGLAPIGSYWSKSGWNPNNVNDAQFDEYYENAQAATTIEEQQEWARKANLRCCRAAMDDQGSHSAPVRCDPTMVEGLQRGRRARPHEPR